MASVQLEPTKKKENRVSVRNDQRGYKSEKMRALHEKSGLFKKSFPGNKR